MNSFFAALCLFSDFDCYQKMFTKEEIQSKIDTYLQKDEELAYTITDEALYLPEYTLYFASTPQPKTISFNKELSGLKVAIDPGHLGGDFAILEERWVKMSPGICFDEGTLTLLTAKVLKRLLEDAGAQVMLTKEKNSCAVYEPDFWTWRQSNPSQPFRTYNSLDLRARAKKINDFHPDLTIIIHYNAHEGRHPETQENIPAHKNYNMVFVGGSFCKDELKEADDRYAFLRLLLTSDLELSIQLSQEILDRFTHHLQVLPVKEEDEIPYLKKASLYINEGVYARNLALTRLVHGPLCYGESLCQDHVQECQRLNAKDLTIDGITGPKRVEQVAQAYFEGIANFLKKSRPCPK